MQHILRPRHISFLRHTILGQHVSCILVIFPDGCPSRRRVGAHNLFFIMASPVGATTCWGSVLRHTIFSSGQGLLLALLGTISGEDRLVTSRLAVEESGAVSGGNHLVASPVGAAELLLCVHSDGDTIRRVMVGSFALLLGTVFGGGYSRLAVIDSGAAYAWGCNKSGQLGLGPPGGKGAQAVGLEELAPRRLLLLNKTRIVSVAAALQHSVLVSEPSEPSREAPRHARVERA